MKDYIQGLTKEQANIKAIELLSKLYQKSWYNLEYDHKDKSGFYYRYNLQGYNDKQILRINNLDF